jgi:hypothetical protein
VQEDTHDPPLSEAVSPTAERSLSSRDVSLGAVLYDCDYYRCHTTVLCSCLSGAGKRYIWLKVQGAGQAAAPCPAKPAAPTVRACEQEASPCGKRKCFVACFGYKPSHTHQPPADRSNLRVP